jgi:rhodanese-related sulfurtransferase
MLKVTIVASCAVALMSMAQDTFAGEGCCHSKSPKSSLQNIKMGEYASKEEKLEAYKKVYADVTYEELVTAVRDKKAIVIDANGTESYEKMHVTGAINFKDDKGLQKALPRDRNALIIAYCGGPKCAAWTSVADYVSKAGYTNIRHYSGGLKEWAEKQASGQKSF